MAERSQDAKRQVIEGFYAKKATADVSCTTKPPGWDKGDPHPWIWNNLTQAQRNAYGTNIKNEAYWKWHREVQRYRSDNCKGQRAALEL
jgi:hypothetical protein